MKRLRKNALNANTTKPTLTIDILEEELIKSGWLDTDSVVEDWYVDTDDFSEPRICVDCIQYMNEADFEEDWEIYQEEVPLGTGQLAKDDYREYLSNTYYDQIIPKKVNDYLFDNYNIEY